MSWFRRLREVLLIEMPDGTWSADMGSPSGQVTMTRGDTPEAALEALRIRVPYADVRRSRTVKVDW